MTVPLSLTTALLLLVAAGTQLALMMQLSGTGVVAHSLHRAVSGRMQQDKARDYEFLRREERRLNLAPLSTSVIPAHLASAAQPDDVTRAMERASADSAVRRSFLATQATAVGFLPLAGLGWYGWALHASSSLSVVDANWTHAPGFVFAVLAVLAALCALVEVIRLRWFMTKAYLAACALVTVYPTVAAALVESVLGSSSSGTHTGGSAPVPHPQGGWSGSPHSLSDAARATAPMATPLASTASLASFGGGGGGGVVQRQSRFSWLQAGGAAHGSGLSGDMRAPLLSPASSSVWGPVDDPSVAASAPASARDGTSSAMAAVPMVLTLIPTVDGGHARVMVPLATVQLAMSQQQQQQPLAQAPGRVRPGGALYDPSSPTSSSGTASGPGSPAPSAPGAALGQSQYPPFLPLRAPVPASAMYPVAPPPPQQLGGGAFPGGVTGYYTPSALAIGGPASYAPPTAPAASPNRQ